MMTSQTLRLLKSRQCLAAGVLVTATVVLSLFVYGPVNIGDAKFRITEMIGQPYPPTSKDEEIQLRFDQRREHLRSVCSRPEYKEPDSGLFVDRYRFSSVAFSRLRWCRIAKVGTTFMKYKFHQSNETRLLDGSVPRRKSFPKKPKSFFFVRDPYSRLVSGYLDKVTSAPDRWGDVGRTIVLSQREDASIAERSCGSDVSFPEFVRYVLWAEKTGKTRNIHFLPMHDLCGVCDRSYDYIGHLETMKEDLNFIVNSVGVSINVNQNITHSIYTQMESIFKTNYKRVKSCLGIWPMMQRMWWIFQARGLIADSIPLTASPQQVESASWEQLASWVVQANQETLLLGSRSAQKRAFMAGMFQKVPLQIRLRFATAYKRDFQLFQYNPFPADIFPEIKNKSGEYSQYFFT